MMPSWPMDDRELPREVGGEGFSERLRVFIPVPDGAATSGAIELAIAELPAMLATRPEFELADRMPTSRELDYFTDPPNRRRVRGVLFVWRLRPASKEDR